MKIDFGTAVRLFFKKYATFTGRATRAEYWWVMLFLFLVSLILSWFGEFGTKIGSVFSLACVVPQFALSMRRLHDSGLTGWIAGIYALLGIAILVWVFVAGGNALYTLMLAPETLDASQIIEFYKAIAWPVLCSVLISIVWIVLMCRKSDGDNQYGPANGNMPSPEE